MAITVRGLDKIQERLKDKATLDDVRRVVSKNGERLTETMKKETTTAYRGGYSGVIQSTGDTASSINLNITDAGMTAKVGATMSYDKYVEYGTRYMPPEPICQPSLDKVKPQFLSDLERLMKK